MIGELDGHGHPFSSAHVEAFERELARHGSVHLTGFSGFSSCELLGSVLGSGKGARVEAPPTCAGLNPHALFHYGPFCPDRTIWSGDDVPALIVDGVDLYRALGGHARRRLASAKLTFRVGVRIPWLEAALGTGIDEVERRWFGGRSIRSGDTATFDHETRAVADTAFGPAVTNGLLGAMDYRSVDVDRARRIAPELDRHTLWEMMDAAFERASEIDWCPGDVLVLDNRRAMVGFAPGPSSLACRVAWTARRASELACAA
jgi:hypothetical protein